MSSDHAMSCYATCTCTCSGARTIAGQAVGAARAGRTSCSRCGRLCECGLSLLSLTISVREAAALGTVCPDPTGDGSCFWPACGSGITSQVKSGRRRAHARRTRALTSTTGASFRRSRRAVGPGATLSQPAPSWPLRLTGGAFSGVITLGSPPTRQQIGPTERCTHVPTCHPASVARPRMSNETEVKPANRTHGSLYPRADVSPGLCSPIADV